MKISENRMRHMHGVAEYMYENAELYGLDKERMYVLGLLHDIGYLYNGEIHEMKGSTLLKDLGYIDSDIILYHGTPPLEYVKLSEHEIPVELRFLLEADMRTGPNGEEMGYSERLKDIEGRYGKDSREAKIARKIIEWLIEVEARERYE